MTARLAAGEQATLGLSRPNRFDLNADFFITNDESTRDRLMFGGRDFQSVGTWKQSPKLERSIEAVERNRTIWGLPS